MGKGFTAPDPSKNPTQPVEPAVKEISVTTIPAANNSTSYSVADNGFATGYLNNGKEINEANVLELLAKAKTIWYNNMTWADNGSANNNWYYNPGAVINKMLRTTYNTSTNTACGGYAAIISDYLFGKNNNPYRQVDISAVRPGDIIVQLNANGTAKHDMVVADTVKEENTVTRIFETDGNNASKVYWAENNGNSWDIWNAWAIEDLGTCVAYTRYPD